MVPPGDHGPRLAELGINKRQSSRWQPIATRAHNLVKANEYARGKIECEAALGEMLAQQLPHEGGRHQNSPRGTVSEIGINKSQSSGPGAPQRQRASTLGFCPRESQ